MAVGAVGMTLPEKGEADESWATGVVGNSTGPVPLGRDSGACFPAGGAVAKPKLVSSAGLMCPGIAGGRDARAMRVFSCVKLLRILGAVSVVGSGIAGSVRGGLTLAMGFLWSGCTRV